MKISGVLDIVNSIAVFQLIFFSAYLFLKGNKIPSTFFLKLHLFFQLISFISYLYWTREYIFIRPLLMISMPSMFLWGPTFYFYIRSRLYKNFMPSWKLLIHGLPAIILMMIILIVLLQGDFPGHLSGTNDIIYYCNKIQLFVYNVYTLYIIYKYQHDLKFQTSASERQKLNWLFLITYGITITSVTDFILFSLSQFTILGWGYIVFWIFINIFFFKAIIHPDQFLGIDEKKLVPLKLAKDKGIEYFNQIDDMIDRNQLFLDPDLSLHNVAQAVKLSDRKVSQAIKQNVTLNFTDYINLKRINYAKERLKNTTQAEKNVLEILYESGFNSKSVFNTQFKKHTGQSPTSYRRVMQSKADAG